jgi:hypothetical protein
MANRYLYATLATLPGLSRRRSVYVYVLRWDGVQQAGSRWPLWVPEGSRGFTYWLYARFGRRWSVPGTGRAERRLGKLKLKLKVRVV